MVLRVGKQPPRLRKHPTDTTIMKQKRSMTTMTMKMKPDMTTKRNFSDTKPTCMPGMTMQPEKPDIRTK